MDWKENYEKWLDVRLDSELKEELCECTDEKELEDRFYKELEFGTGGLRGILGCGTNRMNIYTVARATRGISEYIRQEGLPWLCAIGYDSRIMSREFAFLAAAILAEDGIDVYIYPELAPTPMLSFAVRYFRCGCGIMITASHNPAEYNGYKVYGADGCQITLEAAKKAAEFIGREAYFEKELPDYEEFVENGRIHLIGDEAVKAYEEAVLGACTGMPESALKIVYSPLNGTGNIPVRKVLGRLKNVEVVVVPEQEKPNGKFPTCQYPNPELPAAMKKAAELAKAEKADFFLATDPDCDRVGVGTFDESGEIRLFTGNEVGIILLEYLCRYRRDKGQMPAEPVLVKTIVTTDLADRIAGKYHLEVRNVLTGFKFIGEQVGMLEAQGEKDRYLFGFEESCGYLSGTHVRDKDGVNAAVLVCEAAGYFKKQKKSLLDALREIYAEYGWYKSELLSFEFKGAQGMNTMNKIMKDIREDHKALTGAEAVSCVDYLYDETGLPRSNVFQAEYLQDQKIIIRPSGTEPKIKMYIMVSGESKEQAEQTAGRLCEACRCFISRYMEEGRQDYDT